MTTIEIIGAIIGIIATILGGMWFIINKAIEKGVDKHRLQALEDRIYHSDCKNNKDAIKDIKETMLSMAKNIEKVDNKVAHADVDCKTNSDLIKENNKVIYSVIKELEKVDNRTIHADCKTNKDTINDTKEIVASINKSIERIEKILIAQDSSMLERLSVTHSPRQLNAEGMKLFQVSGADKILDANMETLIKKIEDCKPITAYDVEQQAYAVLLESSFDAWFAPIKNYIYNHPVFNGNLNLNVETLAFVMSLPLRNEFLNRHPEILAE